MKVEKTICDICGADKANSYTIPTYRTFDACDGRTSFPPELVVENVDLCDKCALAATNIHSVGVMSHEYKIKAKKE